MSNTPRLIPIDTSVPKRFKVLTDEEYDVMVLGGYGAVDAFRSGGRKAVEAYLRENGYDIRRNSNRSWDAKGPGVRLL